MKVLTLFSVFAMGIGYSQQPPVNTQGLKWTYLIELPPVEVAVGHNSFQAGEPIIVGSPATVRGTTIRHGIYAHAPSTVVYNLKGGRYIALRGKVALEDRWDGEVEFRIIGDGKVIWKSGVFSKAKSASKKETEYIVNISGVSQLELVVDPLEGNALDHSLWIDPEIGQK
jgi:hypothetical protein